MTSDFGKTKPIRAMGIGLLFSFSLSLLALILDWIPTLAFETLHHPERRGDGDLSFFWRPWVIWLFLFSLIMTGYLYWAHRSRHPWAPWFRWIGRVVFLVLLSGVFLLSAMRTWDVLLPTPWDWIVNGMILASYLLALLMPVVKASLAMKLAEWQDSMNWIALGFSSVAGGLGFWIGMQGGLGRAWVAAFLGTIIAVAFAQYASFNAWQDRLEEARELNRKPTRRSGR